jgi:uncharacterized protein YbaR (Trm112 family)
MKLSHIELLKCIECEGALILSHHYPILAHEDVIERGILCCQSCEAVFPVINGVGVFFRKALLSFFLTEYEKKICKELGFEFERPEAKLTRENILTKQVADNWSYQWNTASPWVKHDFEKDDFNGELCFRKFIRIDRKEYEGKTVVVWCGGNGREAYHISKYQPCLLIVVEIGDEIYRINGLLDQDVNLLLLRCDMLQNPLRRGIADISICDHAIQHIIDRSRAFFTLVDVLSANGIAAVCVYSYENNFLMTHIIEPLKGIIHKMTLKGQEVIALFPAVLIFLLIRLIYMPANRLLPRGLCRMLPLFDHMMFWSKGTFAMIKISCFDLIHAPVSYHFRKGEIQECAQIAGLSVNILTHTHGTTWSMTATKQK